MIEHGDEFIGPQMLDEIHRRADPTREAAPLCVDDIAGVDGEPVPDQRPRTAPRMVAGEVDLLGARQLEGRG